MIPEVAPESWDDLLRRLGCADVYLLRDYAESGCVLDPGEPRFLHVGDSGGDVVFACIVRPIPGSDFLDVTTPYGYGGPVAVGEDPPLAPFAERYERWCAEHGLVSTFIRFHPLFANHRLAWRGMYMSRAGLTVGWPLDDGRDLLEGMDGKHRNSCRKAMRAGVRVEATIAPADLSGFVALYEKTMRRQHADDFYFFPAEYWQRLVALGPRLVGFDAVLGSDVVASALCLVGDRWLHYHLAAADEEGRRLGASNLVLYETAGWGRERGLTTFHLGGGAGGSEDSLFSFKRRFSPGDVLEFWVGKAVHDEEAYRGLTGEEEIELEGFFPAYRVPGALSQTAGTPRPR